MLRNHHCFYKARAIAAARTAADEKEAMLRAPLCVALVAAHVLSATDELVIWVIVMFPAYHDASFTHTWQKYCSSKA